MEGVTIIVGFLSMLGYISKIASLDEWKRILEGEAEYLQATMLDISGRISTTLVQPSKKRKQDHTLGSWIADGEKLVEKTECLLRDIGNWRSCILGPKLNWDAHKIFSALRRHGKEGDELLGQALSNARGLCPTYRIPVKQIVGRVASKTLHKLKGLLEGDKVGRIAIYGEDGVGKTFLMKHLHNWALYRFDCVVWVPSPDEFTINSVQDAIASVVNCDISSDIYWKVRAIKLSQKLAGHGRFALFLDGVPEVDFSLDDILAEGSKGKLVLSTSANSDLMCRMLRSFVTVKVARLQGNEAYTLFEQEAGIGLGVVSSLDKMPRLLANTCHGVPRKIVDLGTHMSGKDDPREWSYELFQSQCYGRNNKLPTMAEPLRRSKRLKRNMVFTPTTSGEGETSSSVRKSG